MCEFLNYIRNPRLLGSALLYNYGGWMPDPIYLKLMFFFQMGKPLHLKNPKTFSEKLQWLKLYNRKPEYTMMVDKYAVKDYVASVIGDEYIIPTLGVWDTPDDIEWEMLPNQFVLKTTHGGGDKGVIICKDIEMFDKEEAVKRLHHSLKQNIYQNYREWPYKNVKPRILAEKYMGNDVSMSQDMTDYKFFCFNGEPRFCQVIKDRHTKETIDFFDMDWQHQEFVGLNPVASPAVICPSKPVCYDTMRQIARVLSKGLPFSRIDLYEFNERVYFGEITFFPRSGFGVFSPEEYNDILGEMIDLPNRWTIG